MMSPNPSFSFTAFPDIFLYKLWRRDSIVYDNLIAKFIWRVIRPVFKVNQ